jgi:GNAT superfamily N-acetyltransferase
VLADDPGPAARDAIAGGLAAFNRPLYGPAEVQSLSVVIEDPVTGAPAGGLLGRTFWRWLYVEMLFVPEALRGRGLARAVLALAEAEALRRGCVGSLIDTFSPVNVAIYGRLGYVTCGTVPDFPPGHVRTFMRKPLATEGS